MQLAKERAFARKDNNGLLPLGECFDKINSWIGKGILY